VWRKSCCGFESQKRSPVPRSPVAPYKNIKEGVVNKPYFDQGTVAGLYATGGMNGLLFFALLFKEIENKKGVVNECYFAVNVKVAGSSPAFSVSL
jgi:hypothetical protein